MKEKLMEVLKAYGVSDMLIRAPVISRSGVFWALELDANDPKLSFSALADGGSVRHICLGNLDFRLATLYAQGFGPFTVGGLDVSRARLRASGRNSAV
jgi:hypothetical protein